MSKLLNILNLYGMYPYYGEKLTSKTLKVYIGDRYVVVKQSNHVNLQQTFDKVFKAAKEKKLTAIAPLFFSREQKTIVNGKKHSYYVMPWIKEKIVSTSSSSYPLFFREIGYIHQKTSFERNYEDNNLQEWVDNQKEKVKKSFFRFEKWIASFEAKHFMSPGELLLCHLYKQVREICHALEYWYDEWFEHISVEKKIRYSLCHGNLMPSHYIVTENGIVFINWEKSYYGHPAKDLALFFHSICIKSDIKINDLLDGLNHYKSQFSMKKSDYTLLALHLLNIDWFFDCLYKFIKKTSIKTEVEWVIKFQQFQFYFDHILTLQNELKSEMIDYEE